MAKDPVCGMTVDGEKATFKSEHMGKTYYFCKPGCKVAFDKEPMKYMSKQVMGPAGHSGRGCCG